MNLVWGDPILRLKLWIFHGIAFSGPRKRCRTTRAIQTAGLKSPSGTICCVNPETTQGPVWEALRGLYHARGLPPQWALRHAVEVEVKEFGQHQNHLQSKTNVVIKRAFWSNVNFDNKQQAYHWALHWFEVVSKDALRHYLFKLHSFWRQATNVTALGRSGSQCVPKSSSDHHRNIHMEHCG